MTHFSTTIIRLFCLFWDYTSLCEVWYWSYIWFKTDRKELKSGTQEWITVLGILKVIQDSSKPQKILTSKQWQIQIKGINWQNLELRFLLKVWKLITSIGSITPCGNPGQEPTNCNHAKKGINWSDSSNSMKPKTTWTLLQDSSLSNRLQVCRAEDFWKTLNVLTSTLVKCRSTWSMATGSRSHKP